MKIMEKLAQLIFTYSKSIILDSKSTLETLEKGAKHVFIVNFEDILHLFLVFLLLALNK